MAAPAAPTDATLASPGPAGAAGAVGGPRLLAPDLLRGVAVVSMLVAHAVPFLPDAPGALRFLMAQVNDVASPLFALVMGMSAQLVAQRTPADGRVRMLAQEGVRGLALVALGLWMATWGTWVAVVLGQLGLLVVVGAPLVLLRTRAVAAVAAIVVLVGAPLTSWAATTLPPALEGRNAVVTRLADWAVLGQQYRVVSLLPFFLLGALLVRHGLRRDRLLWVLLALAPLAYLVAPTRQHLFDRPGAPSGSHPDTLHDLGLVLLVDVAVVLLATSPRVVERSAALLAPLRAAGALALSLYVLHVAVLAVLAPSGVRPAGTQLLGWLAVVPGTVVVALAWWRLVGTGPAEWLLGVVTGRHRWRPAPSREDHRPEGAARAPTRKG